MNSAATRIAHYSQMGSDALILATPFVVWRTGTLPKWTPILAVLGIPALPHVWIGPSSASCTAARLGLVGLALLLVPPKAPQPVSVGA